MQDYTPLLMRNETKITIEKFPLNKKEFDEGWIQRKIFENPELLPTAEVDDVYSNPIPLAMELPTSVGQIDALFISPEGFLVLVETKLWRNHEAKREVVVQVIDYAKELTKWTFETLDAKIKAQNKGGMGIIERIHTNSSKYGKSHLIDKIERNLKSGNILLLIVGDGIRAEVQELVELFQKYPQLQFTLGLVELQIYRGEPTGELLIVPRIVEKTKEIVRATVTIKDASPGVSVNMPEEDVKKIGRFTIKEDQLFEALDKISLGYSDIAKNLIGDAEKKGLNKKIWRQSSLVIALDPQLGRNTFHFLRIDKKGDIFIAEALFVHLKKSGLDSELAQAFCDDVKKVFPQAKKGYFDKKWGKNMGWAVKIADFKETKYEKFLEVLQKHVDIIKDALQSRKEH